MRALRIRERLRAGLVRKRAILMRERVRNKLSRVGVKCRSRDFDVGRWVEHVDDRIIDVVPGRQTNDGLGRRAADEAEASSSRMKFTVIHVLPKSLPMVERSGIWKTARVM